MVKPSGAWAFPGAAPSTPVTKATVAIDEGGDSCSEGQQTAARIPRNRTTLNTSTRRSVLSREHERGAIVCWHYDLLGRLVGTRFDAGRERRTPRGPAPGRARRP